MPNDNAIEDASVPFLLDTKSCSSNPNRRSAKSFKKLFGLAACLCLCMLYFAIKPLTDERLSYYEALLSPRKSLQVYMAALPTNLLPVEIKHAIARIVNEERQNIANAMLDIQYPSADYEEIVEKLKILVPEVGGTPLRSLIVTSWRSGSTFLSAVLYQLRGSYYYYEPLLGRGIVQLRNGSAAQEAVNDLQQLLRCNYSALRDYLAFGETRPELLAQNGRIWRICKEQYEICFEPQFLTAMCELHPFQLMKTVRLRLALAEPLLADESLNVRIILLVRDPRGTMQSRKHRDWCPGNPDCDDPAIVCDDLVADHASAVQLLAKYPSRFRTLRYEDLSLNPYEMTQEVLQFYGLPFDPMVEEFLDTHTKVNIGGVSSTYRDSKSAPFHWKQDLSIKEIKLIQQHCAKAMDLWGYRAIENFTDYQRTFDPIVLPPPFA